MDADGNAWIPTGLGLSRGDPDAVIRELLKSVGRESGNSPPLLPPAGEPRGLEGDKYKETGNDFARDKPSDKTDQAFYGEVQQQKRQRVDQVLECDENDESSLDDLTCAAHMRAQLVGPQDKVALEPDSEQESRKQELQQPAPG